MSRPTAARVKDVLLEHVSRDIKELQKAQSDTTNVVNSFTNSEEQAQSLCDHLDHILLHGIREYGNGYWPFVRYFTRNELVHTISNLNRVTSNVGRGRSWLYVALNEQSMESYVRMFAENQDIAQEFYLGESFMRDAERLLLLLTLVSGLDFISFNLDIDCDYLDYGASQPSSRLGIMTVAQRTPDIEPSFHSLNTKRPHLTRTSSDPSLPVSQGDPQPAERREGLTLSLPSISGAHTAPHAGVEREGEMEEADKGPSAKDEETVSGTVVVPPRLSKSINIPAPGKPHSPMSPAAQGSPQVSPSPQLNTLQRMKQQQHGSSSPPTHSHSLERKLDRTHGLERSFERMRSGGGGEGGEGEGSGEESLVAQRKGRRSGRGKKKHRRKENGDSERHQRRRESATNSSRVHKDQHTEDHSHMTAHKGHVTSDDSHMTSTDNHGTSEGDHMPDLTSHVTSKSGHVTEKARPDEGTQRPPSDSPRETKSSGFFGQSLDSEKESSLALSDTGVGGKGRGAVHSPHSGVDECDFETEPRSPVVGRVRRLGRGEGEGEGEGGEEGGMSLEMELEMAARDVDSQQREGREREQLQGSEKEDREEEESISVSHGAKGDGETGRGRGEGVQGGGGGGGGGGGRRSGGSEQVSPFEVIGGEGGSERGSHSSPESRQSLVDLESPLVGDGSPSPTPVSTSPSPRTHHRKHYHTSPTHTSHPHSSHTVHPSVARRIQPTQRQRRDSPECEEDYDVITQSEMRELVERRGRANAVVEMGEQRLGGREGEEEGEEEGEGEGQQRPNLRRVASTPADEVHYDGPPMRSQHAAETDRRVDDVKVDENMRLVFSLDVFITPEEDVVRLVQVQTPAGMGQYRVGYVLVTSEALYLLRRDGVEGIFSREIGVRFNDIDHLVIGLGWQSMELIYWGSSLEGEESLKELHSCVILTGNEAVSRSVMSTIQSSAAKCPSFRSVIPKNRDDESRIQAIRKELTELGSEASMDIVQYSLVNWEQVKGDAPDIAAKATTERVRKNGMLHFKSLSMLGRLSWKQAFFELRDGTLYQYVSESEKVTRATYQLTGCGGCTRVTGEGKPFTISIALSNTQPLLLATHNEEELTQWMQALCEAVVEAPSSAIRGRSCLSCAALVTKNKIYVLQEDLSNRTIQQVTSCEVTAVEEVRVDRLVPLYCTISYDDGEGSKGAWLLCFSSEQELGKFESALGALWKAEFQIDLPFAEISDPEVRGRAHKAVELMQASRLRSDSITKGRTEFTYGSVF